MRLSNPRNQICCFRRVTMGDCSGRKFHGEIDRRINTQSVCCECVCVCVCVSAVYVCVCCVCVCVSGTVRLSCGLAAVKVVMWSISHTWPSDGGGAWDRSSVKSFCFGQVWAGRCDPQAPRAVNSVPATAGHRGTSSKNSLQQQGSSGGNLI